MAAGRQRVAFSGIAATSAKRLQCPELGWMEWRGGRTDMTAMRYPPPEGWAHYHQFSEGALQPKSRRGDAVQHGHRSMCSA